MEQNLFDLLDPTIWSKTAGTLKRTKNLNTFKHKLKEENYLKELKNYNSRLLFSRSKLFILKTEVCNIALF